MRLAQIIAVITELSEQKKQDFYKFLIDLKKKTDTIPDDDVLQNLIRNLRDLQELLSRKVDKVNGKGLSSNDFTNELRDKLLSIVGNVQANWNTNSQSDPSYIANKPDIYTKDEIDELIATTILNLNIPSSQIQSDWNQTDNSKKDFIKNKPDVYTKQEVNDLINEAKIGGSVDTSNFELKTNKVVSISAQSTDDEYPSAKCVYDVVGNIESALQAILN